MSFTRPNSLKSSLYAMVGPAMLNLNNISSFANPEADLVEVVEMRLRLPRLARVFDGYRLAQISDIHMGTGMTPERLMRIVRMVNAQKPDAVAITGDFVTLNPVSYVAESLVRALSRLRANDGVYAVLGNHDHFSDAQAVRQIIRDSGMVELSNHVHTLRRGDELLHMAGVDDHYYDHDRMDDVLGQMPEAGAAVLLAHVPDYADISAATGRFDLQISGHSHGGQIRLPGAEPLALPRLCKKYPSGLYQVGGMMQYTNRGLGTVILPIRFNCRPEITVFTLEAGG